MTKSDGLMYKLGVAKYFLRASRHLCVFYSPLWLSLLGSHLKILKMGQRIVQNKGMTPKKAKMRHVKETEDAPA